MAHRRVTLLGDEHEIELSTPRGLDRVGLAHHTQLWRAGTSGRSVRRTGQALKHTVHALEVAYHPAATPRGGVRTPISMSRDDGPADRIAT